MKKRIVKICIPLLIIIICLLINIIKDNAGENEPASDFHEHAKQEMLNYLQSVIDKNEDGSSFQTYEYEFNGEIYQGNIYVVNKVEDIKLVKRLLEYCEPIYGVREYAPMPAIFVFVGGINIGYGDNNLYTFMYNKTRNEFNLPKEYNDKLWDFLYSLEMVYS